MVFALVVLQDPASHLRPGTVGQYFTVHKFMNGRATSLQIVQEILAGEFTPEVCSAVQDWFSVWDRAGGSVRFERCAHLPSTVPAYQRAKRDLWLANAAKEVEGDPGTVLNADKLAFELSLFNTRGEWRFWQGLSDPPDDASALRKALFYVCRYGNGNVIGSRQIFRILSGGPDDIFSINEVNGSTVK